MKQNRPGNLELKSLDQFKKILFDEKKGYCSANLSRQVYSIEAVQFAAHHLAGEMNIIIESSADGEIFIEIFSKDADSNIKDLFWKFNESLIAYTVYLIQSDRNKQLRDTILKKALSSG